MPQHESADKLQQLQIKQQQQYSPKNALENGPQLPLLVEKLPAVVVVVASDVAVVVVVDVGASVVVVFVVRSIMYQARELCSKVFQLTDAKFRATTRKSRRLQPDTLMMRQFSPPPLLCLSASLSTSQFVGKRTAGYAGCAECEHLSTKGG